MLQGNNSDRDQGLGIIASKQLHEGLHLLVVGVAAPRCDASPQGPIEAVVVQFAWHRQSIWPQQCPLPCPMLTRLEAHCWEPEQQVQAAEQRRREDTA